jgi:transcriptional regulator GlxA family with amidase domain
VAVRTGGGREAGPGDDGDAVRLGQDLLDDEPAGDQREEALGHSGFGAACVFPLCAHRTPPGLPPSRNLREDQDTFGAYSEATIHWAYVASLTRYPGVRVRPERALVVTGAGERIVMGGGGTSWQDVALFLIGRHVGLKEAREVARTYLVDWHEHGQRPFASLLIAKQTDDALITRCQEWAAMNYASASPVTAMMRMSGLPERSFVRRFTRATGMSPLEYVHRLRLEEAKQMLETGDASVEVVAAEVGYQDASFFGRLFRRHVGLTPAHYRRRFGSLRRALEK